MAANSGAAGASSETASAIMYTVPASYRKSGMSKPSPGSGRTQAARSGSAMNARALDMTIRTVAVVFCASLRSSERDDPLVGASCGEDPFGNVGVGAGDPGGDGTQVVVGEGGGVEVTAQVVAG